ncbi:MAG: GA module-containing protein [Corynebacterium sp.]|nr:GA module-containing protein [Corynebacterium sp.]
MSYGKRSISQMLGSMALAASISAGVIAAPSYTANAVTVPLATDSDSPLHAKVDDFRDGSQIYGEFNSDGKISQGNYTFGINTGLWSFNSVFRTAEAEITDSTGKKKYWASAGDTVKWTIEYEVYLNTDQEAGGPGNTFPVYNIALPLAAPVDLSEADVKVTYTPKSTGVPVTLPFNVTQATYNSASSATPFKTDGTPNISTDSSKDSDTGVGRVQKVNWVNLQSTIGAKRWLTGDKMTITVERKAASSVEYTDEATAAGKVKIDPNASVFTDIVETYRTNPSDTGFPVANSRLWNQNRAFNWQSAINPFLQVGRATFSVTNNIGQDITYTVGSDTKTVNDGKSSTALGVPYGEYKVSTQVGKYTAQSARSVTLGEYGKDGSKTVTDKASRDKVGPTGQLVLTKDDDFPILSKFSTQFNELINLEGPALSQAEIQKLVDEMQLAKTSDEADAIVAKAKAEANKTPADRIDALPNLTQEQKKKYKELAGTTDYSVVAEAAKVDAAMGASPTTEQNQETITDNDKAAAKAVATELGLTGDEPDTFNNDIESATNAGEIADKLKAAFKKAFEDPKKFPNLTPAQLEAYKKAIGDLDATKAPVSDFKKIFDSAKALGEDQALDTPKDETVASAADKAAALAELKALGIESGELVNKINGSNATIKDLAEAIQTARSDTKQSAIDAIDAMDYLTPKQKEDYIAKVNAATTGSAITAIKDNAQEVNDALKDGTTTGGNAATKDDLSATAKAIEELGVTLDENAAGLTDPQKKLIAKYQGANVEGAAQPTTAELAAILRIAEAQKIDSLPGLTDDQKASYKKQLLGDSTVSPAVAPANAADTKAILDGASDVSASNPSNTDEASRTAALAKAPTTQDKAAAQAAVDALGLTAPAKTNADQAVQDADTNEKLLAAIKQAQEAKIDSLDGLTEAQKNYYKGQLDGKSSQDASAVVAEAEKVNNVTKNPAAEGNDTKASADDVAAAEAAITALGVDPEKLSDAEKQAYNEAVDKLKSTTEGEPTVAQVAAAVKAAQKAAIQQLPGLTDKQVESYTKALDEGNTTGPTAEQIIEDAKNVSKAAGGDTDAKSATPSAADKKAAQDAVDALNLTDPAKSTAAQAIQNANSNEALLDAIKQAQKDKIDSLPGLTQAQKNSYKKQLDEDANNGQTAADLVAEAEKLSNVAVDPNAEGNDKPVTEKDITAAKAAVTDLAVDTTKLSEAEKKAYDEAVEKLNQTSPNLPTAAEVANALKTIEKAKIDSLDGLTKEQKESYKQKLDAPQGAGAGAGADTIIAEAQKAADTATNPQPPVKDEEAKQDDIDAAKAAIQKLTDGITPSKEQQDLIDKLDSTNPKPTYEDVANAVVAAQQAKVDSLENLTPEQKTEYKKAISDNRGEKADEILNNAQLVDAAKGGTATEEQKKTPANATDIKAAKDALAQIPDPDTENLSTEQQQALKDAIAKLDSTDPAPTVADVAAAVAAKQDALKAAAAKQIDDLKNLTPAQKQFYKDSLATATPEEADAIADTAKNIDGVMGTASASREGAGKHEATEDAAYNAATEAASDTDIAAAKAAIDAMDKLPQADREALKNKLPKGTDAQGTSQATVADVLKEAIAAWNSKYNDEIDALDNLTEAQKQSYKDAIAAAGTDTDKAAVVAAATKVDTAMAADDSEGADTTAATEDDKAAAKAAIDALKDQLDAAGVDTSKAPYSNVNLSEPTVGQLAEAVKAAKNAAKDAAKQAIDELKNLTDEQKASYKKAVDDGDAAAAQGIVDAATKVDTAMGADDFTNQDPATAEDTIAGKAAVDAYAPLLTAAGVDLNETPYVYVSEGAEPFVGQVAEAVKSAQQAGKQAAKDAIDALQNLTPAQKQSYKDDIDAAKGGTAVVALLDGAKKVDAALVLADPTTETTTATDNDITAAKAELEKLGFGPDDQYYKDLVAKVPGATQDDPETNISAGKVADIIIKASRDAESKKLDALTNLTDEQRADYAEKIKAANPNDIPGILETATNVNAMMGADPTQEQQTAAAEPATDKDIAAATAAIKAFGLPTEEEEKFLGQLAPNKSQADVAETVLKALNASKDAAKAAIDALENLTPEQKQSYKDAVDAANGAGAIDKVVETATNVDAIMGGNPTQEQSVAADADKTQADVDAATDAINALSNLSDADRAKFVEELKGVSSQADVAKKVLEALNASKDAAKAAIDELEYLTPAQKQSYKDSVDAAKGAEAINGIVVNATNVNAVMGGQTDTPAAVAAAEPKNDADVTAAEAAINAFTNLTQVQKDALLEELNDRDESQADVAETVLKALNASKDAAKAAIDALENLTPEQKQSYKDAVDAANGAGAIDKVVETATNVDAIMGGNPTQEQSVAADADKTQADVDAATDAINALSNLSDADRAKFVEELKGVSSQADVAKKVLEALNASKDAAKAAINKLTNLSAAEKEAFLNQVDLAKGAADINKAVLDATKQDALNAIDAMKNLTPEEKAKAKASVNEATEVTDIADLINNNGSDNNDRFNSALEKAKAALAAAQAEYDQIRYSNASPEVKKAFEDRIDALNKLIASATGVDGVNLVSAEELEAATDALVEAQDELDGKKKISWLTILLIAGGVATAGAAAWYFMTNQAAGGAAGSSAGGVAPGAAAVPGAPAPAENAQPAPQAEGSHPAADSRDGILAVTGAQVRGIGLLAMVLIAIGGIFAFRRRRGEN